MKNQDELKIVRVFKSIFNVRWWIDYDRLKAFTLYLFTGIKKMVIPNKTTLSDSKESFSEAVKSLHLNKAQLEERKKALYRLSWFMVTLAFGVFCYAVYQGIYGSLRAFIVSLIVSLIALALAFRYHFWYFQIAQHKLGCSFKEWYRKGLLGDKK